MSGTGSPRYMWKSIIRYFLLLQCKHRCKNDVMKQGMLCRLLNQSVRSLLGPG